MFRAGVIATIRNDFDITGEAGDVDSSIAMIASTTPDVVLLDVHVPGGFGGGGSEIILRSVEHSPQTLYLALSVSDSPADVGAVIRAGARGYVTKTITAEDLIASVKQVADGYAVFSPKLAGFVLTAFNRDGGDDGAAAKATSVASQMEQTQPTLRPSVFSAGGASGEGSQENREVTQWGGEHVNSPEPLYSADDIDVLSPREQEVMRLIARGYSYKEVASELFISIKTVETHVSAVLRKLQLSNRGELARWAAHRRIV
jgi:DNA-binding NarL/FixJ family response regulator